MENGKVLHVYSEDSDYSKSQEVHTIFYGKGRGLHSTKPFTGLSMKDVLKDFVDFGTNNLQQCLIVVIADDGYRTVFTYSELCNRNDQANTLLVRDSELKDNGIFRLFPACDFFSDRAIKGIDRIFIVK